MPPKKKPRNAFFFFMIEYKEKQERRNKCRMDMMQAQNEAGKLWAQMNPQQRGPYIKMAKDDKLNHNLGNDKYTSSGVPLSQIEKEQKEKDMQERMIKKDIENTVKAIFAENTYEDYKFYFIHVNYFSKTLEGNVYIPAELAISCYTLKDGIINTFHTFINPGSGLFGHAYEAKHHSETTHQLPLPPNALGESKIGKIHNEIIQFLRSTSTDGSDKLPPLYTHNHINRVVESSLDFIRNADLSDDDPTILQVYPIHYLFYEMGMKVAEKSESQKPENYYVMEALFNRDVYEHRSGIACDYHEKVDASKFCSLSAVIRWGYEFSDNFCLELAISLVPGRHIPAESDLQVAKTYDTKNLFNDTESMLSDRTLNSTVRSDITQPKIEQHEVGGSFSGFSQKDFPTLGAPKKRYDDGRIVNKTTIDSDDEDIGKPVNPWTVRGRVKPRTPDESSFDFASVISGRGRGIAVKSETSSANVSVKSFGRGRYFHQE